MAGHFFEGMVPRTITVLEMTVVLGHGQLVYKDYFFGVIKYLGKFYYVDARTLR